ncbi:hypothetical protein GQ53DRAFT_816216 [Thozetella sp. PMI_491]|nr:hypothetical protein GQ53DRAFT_816216 [Thozetella sp. PMI_491]
MSATETSWFFPLSRLGLGKAVQDYALALEAPLGASGLARPGRRPSLPGPRLAVVAPIAAPGRACPPEILSNTVQGGPGPALVETQLQYGRGYGDPACGRQVLDFQYGFTPYGLPLDFIRPASAPAWPSSADPVPRSMPGGLPLYHASQTAAGHVVPGP